MRTVHCPWCSKDVKVTPAGWMTSHLNGSALCIGSGIGANAAETIYKHNSERRTAAEQIGRRKKR